MSRYSNQERTNIKEHFKKGGKVFAIFLTNCIEIKTSELLNVAFKENRILSNVATTL